MSCLRVGFRVRYKATDRASKAQLCVRGPIGANNGT